MNIPKPPTKFLIAGPEYQPQSTPQKRRFFLYFPNLGLDPNDQKKSQPNGSGVPSIPRLTRRKTRGNIQREKSKKSWKKRKNLSESRAAGELCCIFCFCRLSYAIPFITDIHLFSVRIGGGRQAGDIHERSQSNMMRCVPMMLVDLFVWSDWGCSSFSYNSLLVLLPLLLYRDRFSRYFNQ